MHGESDLQEVLVMKFIIYYISNSVNLKSYIGLTSRTLQTRWQQHKSRARKGSSLYLHAAMRKHGIDNFSISELDSAKSAEEACYKEMFHIGFFQTYESNKGYNLTYGGDYGSHTAAVRKVLSDKAKSRNVSGAANPNFGKRWSVELREQVSTKKKLWCADPKNLQQMRECRTGILHTEEAKKRISVGGRLAYKNGTRRKQDLSGTRNPFYGRKHTEETKEKIRAARLAKGRKA